MISEKGGATCQRAAAARRAHRNLHCAHRKLYLGSSCVACWYMDLMYLAAVAPDVCKHAGSRDR